MPLPTFLPLVAAAGLLFPGLPTPPPESVLTLTLEHTGTPRPSEQVTLTCDPDEGSHPTPEIACEELTRAGGDVRMVGANDRACTDHIEDPKKATARGHWQGRVVNEEVYFGNPCEFATRAGHVFRINGE